MRNSPLVHKLIKKDISDADFEALQAKMFSGKEGKGSKSKKSRA